MTHFSSTKLLLFPLAFVFAALLLPAESHAEYERGFLGIRVGGVSVNRGIGSGFGYGLNSGYFFTPNWGGGVFVRSSNHDFGVTQFGFGGEALFKLERTLPGLSLGANLGGTKFSGENFDGNFHLSGGFKAAYDYLLPTKTSISIGADTGAQWTKPTNKLFTIFHILLTAKYHFG